MTTGITDAIRGLSGNTGGTASAQVKSAGGNMGKDEFLKLFVAQLKNQDPTNPMDGKDLAAQLAQFSSVEQLIQLNQGLESQAASQSALLGATNGSIAMGTIGKTVLASGDRVAVRGGAAEVTVGIGGTGGRGTLKVYDASGTLVGSRELGMLGPGRNSVPLGSAATGLADGTYTYEVEVMNGETAVTVDHFIRGRVDGVTYTQAGPRLTIGGIPVDLGAVVEVTG